MTKQSKREYIDEIRAQYHQATRKEQSRILDQMVKLCKMHRKYLSTE